MTEPYDSDQLRWIAFDVYCTLVDRAHSAEREFKEILDAKGKKGVDSLAAFHAWHDGICSRYNTRFVLWSEAARDSLADLYRSIGISPADVDADTGRLLGSFARWMPFPDVNAVLNELRRHYKIAVVTNMDNVLFEKTNIGVPIDAAITSEMAWAYKPNPEIFSYTLRRLGIRRGELLWVGTTPWSDIMGSRMAMLPMAWINRDGVKLPPWHPKPDYEFPDLWGLRELLLG